MDNERLQEWFGLSYASWLTLPRVMMEAMPDEWQQKMADLLFEFQDTFENAPNIPTMVVTKDEHHRFKSFPDWVLNYRYPDREQLDSMKKR